MRFKRGDLVFVEWEDAIAWPTGWDEINTFVAQGDSAKAAAVQSAGIVLKHAKGHLMLAGSIHIGRANEVHRIPVSQIRRIVRLAERRSK